MKPVIAVMGPHGQNLLYNSVSISTVSLNEVYANSVIRAGGIPFVIPPLTEKEDLFRLIDQCDGILLPGGEDVDPMFYHQSPSAKLGRINRTFDEAWIAVGRYAVEKGIPIMGICRGMQIMNVALGGSLYQDLSEVNPSHLLHGQHQDRSYPIHSVDVDKDSNLARILGQEQVYTNTMHHQSVHEVGKGLKVVAHTEDGIVEALEDERGTGMIQLVQWHPEELQDSVPCMRNLFKNLIDMAVKHANQ